MKIALAQMQVYPADLRKNTQNILSLIAEAKSRGADLVIFPELAVSGLLVGDNWRDHCFIADCLAANEMIAEAAKDISVIFGNIAGGAAGQICNSCFIACDGQLQQLAPLRGNSSVAGAYGFFSQAGTSSVSELWLEGKLYRLAVLLGKWQEELYIPDDIDLLIHVDSSPLVFGEEYAAPKLVEWVNAPLVHVNCCGMQNSGKTNYLMAGGSALYSAAGELLASLPLLEEDLLCCSLSGGNKAANKEADALLFEALVYGAREFTREAGINKAVIGLSGGIDSALAACVYQQALGAENVLLINMPSCYSSKTTRSLAAELAVALGANYAVMPVQDFLLSTKELFARTPISFPGREDWHIEISGLTEENVQARGRTGQILATAAAGWGAIFTCNGNKAECSVGYATFYGDLAGAFALSADLWKYQVYQASAYAEKLIPAAAETLDKISKIKPSAELSAQQAVEEGKGDPLIYPYHDYLLAAWVEKDANPYDILLWYSQGVLSERIGCAAQLIPQLFPTTAAIIADIEYWWRMYRGMGVAKRIQAPPLLALSARPFGDPKGENRGEPYFGSRYESLKKQLLEE